VPAGPALLQLLICLPRDAHLIRAAPASEMTPAAGRPPDVAPPNRPADRNPDFGHPLREPDEALPVRDEADLLAGRVQEGLRGQRGVLASARKSLETGVCSKPVSTVPRSSFGLWSWPAAAGCRGVRRTGLSALVKIQSRSGRSRDHRLPRLSARSRQDGFGPVPGTG
jgi:hypothetical protein